MSTSDLSIGLEAGEEICDLQLEGLKIIQKKDAFRFGTDAVLLSDFTKLRKRDLVADFGTGTGAIALLLAGHNPEIAVKALEIQPEMAVMARRSVELNGLEGRIEVLEADIRDAAKVLGSGRLDAVVCNPPYFEASSGKLPQNENKVISRVEAQISIEEICASAKSVLKSGGRLSVIYPARSLPRLMEAMRGSSLEPKRIRTVINDIYHAPKLILLDAVKQGGRQLDWLPPLILRNPDGSPSDEWRRIYG